ncbi:DUF4129 domain-containing protein [Flavobacterium sp. MFBS3-15]|uniref:DUF4129 domain-containing protein n=1 Tax=Flavobacterium sp. MFBS3-15 TaxID=2989816 RepID=UPI0022366049|nr:DUF4129 domain-containing protein [Flavobacterium sp. MFBS3-15]MCW4468381.1 DUF4129 domain-containing protein [Flavobacterium sp. MFBS3-15]
MNRFLLCILLLLIPLAACPTTVQDSVAFKEAQAQPEADLPYAQRSFEEGFKDSYSGSDFNYEPKKPAKKTAWDRFKEWLGEVLRSIFFGEEESGKGKGWSLTLKILAFVLIGIAVYFISRALLNKQGYWIFGKARKKINVQDADEENIHGMDLVKLVAEASHAGNYRLAVRYYYLWLLKKLADREVIRLHRDKTNSDYLYEIRDNGLRKDFEYLSYVYDHSWYGEFPIDRAAYDKAERAFRKTLNTL